MDVLVSAVELSLSAPEILLTGLSPYLYRRVLGTSPSAPIVGRRRGHSPAWLAH